MRRTAMMLLGMLLTACAAPVGASPEPTITALPTATVPATATVSATVTAPPSPTPAPSTAPPTASASPTARPAPETPHPVSSLDQIIDIFWVFDPDALGPNTVNFHEDGTYRLGHGPYPGKTVWTGTFSLDGDVLTWNEGWFDCPADMSGTYSLGLRLDETLLTFKRLDDSCSDRFEGLDVWGEWRRGKPPLP